MGLSKVEFIPVSGIPPIKPGDNLAEIISDCLSKEGLKFQNGDILALAQKIVSKSEGQLINLAEVVPSSKALELAPLVGKDPRHVEVILRESQEILTARPGIFVVVTHHGYVCANAGVDRSNIEQTYWRGKENTGQLDNLANNSVVKENWPGAVSSSPSQPAKDEWVCLLPKNPDHSAAQIRARIEELTGWDIPVLINDTHGRPFRMGGVGIALGSAGLISLVDQRGEQDMFGYTLQATQVGFGDELAAAASLIMGQASEGTPAILIRGLIFRRPASNEVDPGAASLIRSKEQDIFRYPAKKG